MARTSTKDEAQIEFCVISVRFFVMRHDTRIIKCKIKSNKTKGNGTKTSFKGYCLNSQLVPSFDFTYAGGHSDKHWPLSNDNPCEHFKQKELSVFLQRSHPS